MDPAYLYTAFFLNHGPTPGLKAISFSEINPQRWFHSKGPVESGESSAARPLVPPLQPTDSPKVKKA